MFKAILSFIFKVTGIFFLIGFVAYSALVAIPEGDFRVLIIFGLIGLIWFAIRKTRQQKEA